MTRVLVQTPAKLNLGLAVTGRRPDGFHDLVTILVTVSRFDRLRLTAGGRLHLTASDRALETSDNLALAAMRALRSRAGISQGALLQLDKTIPVAAGLGGASSDAAAALLGANRLWEAGLDAPTLHDLATGLGSDVPFFLHGGAALATGRGDRIATLPVPQGLWFVVAVPALQEPIPRKTATLYAALSPRDLSDGGEILAQAQRLRAGLPLDSDLLGNSFRRPLRALRPEVTEIESALLRAGAPFVALTGAGPCHYTALPSAADAAAISAGAARELGGRAIVFIAQPVVGAPRLEVAR